MNEQSEPAWAAVNSALADELGVDRRYVYQMESGVPTLYTRRLFAMLRLLDVRMEVHAR
ncbi:helix-turn-helix domain-containing protein [Cellulomonas xiejunii]|uniref:Helix-turn-helix domain-containing protein n=1 Tax=Cellulomonas xiejunii TaxID=2968083 RepID=A0ABY5KR12_9CELL|nr:helix-turn-helix transcriptional regulator [Cellulomonas xiejunii]MCC2323454.1 helix-turn-helix domain-containing protein [Cellulomonas xiejunii]UUI71616.1 helix-turn-helix domain-containing protein [Cellulomonas xiejunii]